MRARLRLLASAILFGLGVCYTSEPRLLAQEQSVGAVSCKLLTAQKHLLNERFPLIKLNSEEQLLIDFDLFEQSEKHLSYRLVHCNSDWQPSYLQTIEYINGFAEYELAPATYSNGTLQSYLHYQLSLPNEMTQIKHSGNYLLEVFDDDAEREPILSLPFGVYESDLNIDAEVSSQSYQESRGEKQQVNLKLKLSDADIHQASREIKTIVLQNGRWDNAISLREPSSLQEHTLVYEGFNGAVFGGGNEYHKVEHLYDRGIGIGVLRQDLWAGVYRLVLDTQKNRSRKAYVYDKDQNGRSYIRSMETDNPDTEADYHWIDFSFKSPKLSGGDIFIEGAYFDYLPLQKRKMLYNEIKGVYELRLLVKEGYQEYQYLFLPYGTRELLSSPTEGDHYQTTNDYQVLVYRRGISDRADRLVASQNLD